MHSMTVQYRITNITKIYAYKYIADMHPLLELSHWEELAMICEPRYITFDAIYHLSMDNIDHCASNFNCNGAETFYSVHIIHWGIVVASTCPKARQDFPYYLKLIFKEGLDYMVSWYPYSGRNQPFSSHYIA